MRKIHDIRTVALLGFLAVLLYFLLLFVTIYAKLIIVLFRNVPDGFEVMLWKQRVDFISRK